MHEPEKNCSANSFASHECFQSKQVEISNGKNNPPIHFLNFPLKMKLCALFCWLNEVEF